MTRIRIHFDNVQRLDEVEQNEAFGFEEKVIRWLVNSGRPQSVEEVIDVSAEMVDAAIPDFDPELIT